MDRPLTTNELQIAARQAITLALAMRDDAARDDLLMRARRLLEEAESGFKKEQDAGIVFIPEHGGGAGAGRRARVTKSSSAWKIR
jgi:hypothetical protein